MLQYEGVSPSSVTVLVVQQGIVDAAAPIVLSIGQYTVLTGCNFIEGLKAEVISKVIIKLL